MFISLVEIVDVFKLGTIHAFILFFVASWALFLYRLRSSSKYIGIEHERKPRSISVIIPVLNEPLYVWEKVLDLLKQSLVGIDNEVFVVCNGSNSIENGRMASAAEYGFTVIYEENPGKRNAIAVAARRATKEICVILDSDTFATYRSIDSISRAFTHDLIGGVTPRHEISRRKRNIWRRISSWMEDIRFNNTLRGLSAEGVVNCLPGRLFAIRTSILKQLLPRFTSQRIFGVKIETGDDRVLTQWMLEMGYETLYDDFDCVYTAAPDTLAQFVKQRLRWARSSFREGMGSLRNLFTPSFKGTISWYSIADIILRWWFFSMLVAFVVELAMGTGDVHFLKIQTWQYIVFGLAGFLLNGLLRQIPHLRRFPEDFRYLPIFLFVSLFILTPVEIIGNLTFLKQGWLTRRDV